jgi:hypothetical protein
VVSLGLALTLLPLMGVLGACLALLISSLVRAGGAMIAIGWLIVRQRARERSRLATDGATPARIVGAPAER